MRPLKGEAFDTTVLADSGPRATPRPSDASSERWTGARMDHFDVERPIARGGMGVGVSGPRPISRSACGAQGPSRRAREPDGAAGTLHSRGASAGPPQLRVRRPHLLHRADAGAARAAGLAILRHGAGRRRRARERSGRRRCARARARAKIDDPGRQRTRRCRACRHHPPRHQAQQSAAGSQRRSQDRGFRRRQARGGGGHRDHAGGRGRRQSAVHGARASEGRGRGSPRRHVLARLHVLPPHGRQAAVRRPHTTLRRGQALERSAGAAVRRRAGRAARACRDRRSVDVQGRRRAISPRTRP